MNYLDEDVDPSRLSPWLLRIVLDRAKMLDKKLGMADVVGKISSCFGANISCLCNDDNSPQLVIRIRIVNEQQQQKDQDEAANSQPREEEDVFLRRLEGHILDGIILKGIPGIRRVFIVEARRAFVNAEGEWSTGKEWVLETEGLNLKEIFTHPAVDFTRCSSNNLIEVMETLGIEAALKQMVPMSTTDTWLFCVTL